MPILKNMKHAAHIFIAPLSHKAVWLSVFIGFLLFSGGTGQAERLEQPDDGAPHEQTVKQSLNHSPEFSSGVKAYREGDYIQARRIFSSLHKQAPEDSRTTYYLAITEAQLGRFQSAKKLYEEIITLNPNGEAARLAKEGLQYLPAETKLDLPPRFQAGATETGQPKAAMNPQTPSQPGAIPASPGAGMLPNGMSMQDWMALQMMMGQGGNNSNNGAGMMPWMMMPQAGADPNNPGGYDPNAMSTMLMNQMLQNFSLSGDKDDNR